MTPIFYTYLSFTCCPVLARDNPPPLIPSLPHVLLYPLVSFIFPFLTRFTYFLAFPSLLILPE